MDIHLSWRGFIKVWVLVLSQLFVAYLLAGFTDHIGTEYWTWEDFLVRLPWWIIVTYLFFAKFCPWVDTFTEE